MDPTIDRIGGSGRHACGVARRIAAGALTLVVALAACRTTPASASAAQLVVAAMQEGLVSWYGAAFHDRPTASGERFDSNGFTMAHPTLPFGTEVKVTNLRNGRSVVVRVNDRGPHVGRRIADLSRAAAAELGMLKRGVVRARIEVLGADGTVADAGR
jgi:rare lipoprotein A